MKNEQRSSTSKPLIEAVVILSLVAGACVFCLLWSVQQQATAQPIEGRVDSLWQAYCAAGDTASAAEFVPGWYELIDKRDVYPQQRDTVWAMYAQRLIDGMWHIKTQTGPRWVDDARRIEGSKNGR